jgi:hypothetical protein
LELQKPTLAETRKTQHGGRAIPSSSTRTLHQVAGKTCHLEDTGAKRYHGENVATVLIHVRHKNFKLLKIKTKAFRKGRLLASKSLRFIKFVGDPR